MDKDVSILAILGYEGFYGAERANYKVLDMLSKQGASIYCITSENANSEYIQMLNGISANVYVGRFGPTYFGLHKNTSHYFGNLSGMLRISRLLIKAIKDHNITHIYIPNYIQFLYVYFGLFFIKKIVVFRVGDPPEQNKLHCFLWRMVINPHVDSFVTNSKSTQSKLLNHGVEKRNTRVIKNCITRDIVNSKSKKTGAITIICVGQITKHKGIDLAVLTAINICKEYHDVEFLFFGGIDEKNSFTRECIELVNNSPFTDRILFKGFARNIESIYSKADLLICPSVQEESSANSVVESKFFRIPAVVFPRGGLPELINHKVDGYLCKNANIDSLDCGIRYFLDDKVNLTRCGKNALISSDVFTEKVISKEWINLFQSTVKK